MLRTCSPTSICRWIRFFCPFSSMRFLSIHTWIRNTLGTFPMSFWNLIKKHIGSNLQGPFNNKARLLSDFSQAELDYLETSRKKTN